MNKLIQDLKLKKAIKSLNEVGSLYHDMVEVGQAIQREMKTEEIARRVEEIGRK